MNQHKGKKNHTFGACNKDSGSFISLSQLRFYNIDKYLYHTEEQKSKFSVQTNCIELITNKSIFRFLAPLSIALLQIKNFLTRSFDC